MRRGAKCGRLRQARTGLPVLLLAVLAAAGPAVAAGCLDDCKRRLQTRVEICQLLFEDRDSSYFRNVRWHATCLEKAQVAFDNCRAFC